MSVVGVIKLMMEITIASSSNNARHDHGISFTKMLSKLRSSNDDTECFINCDERMELNCEFYLYRTTRHHKLYSIYYVNLNDLDITMNGLNMRKSIIILSLILSYARILDKSCLNYCLLPIVQLVA